MRKQCRTLLAALLSIVLIFSFSACEEGSSSSVTLVDFEDATASVEAGSVYTVENPQVLDTEGNAYTATYTVKTASGESLTVIDGKFNVNSDEDHIVTYTVKAGGKTFERKLTLKVTDSVGPQISIEDPQAGVAGQLYTLPSITAYDAVDGLVEPEIKVFFGQIEQTLTDRAFTPDQPGEYTLVVDAKDKKGNSAATVTKSIFIVNATAENVLAGFSFDASELTNGKRTWTHAGHTSGWEFEFEGRQGVAWQTSGDLGVPDIFQYAIGFSKTEEELTELLSGYTESDYLTMWIYLDTEEATPLYLHSALYTPAGAAYGASVPGKTWVNVWITLENLYAQMDAWGYASYHETMTPSEFFVSQVCSANPYGAYFFDAMKKDIRIYYDEVALHTRSAVGLEVTPDTIVAGSESAFTYTVSNPNEEAYTLTVTAPDGTEIHPSDGTFLPEQYGEYTFTLVPENGIDVIVKTVKVTSPLSLEAEAIAESSVGSVVTLPGATLVNNNSGQTVDGVNVVATVKIGEIIVPVEDGKIVIAQEGDYTVTYAVEYEGQTYTKTTQFHARPQKLIVADFNNPENLELNGQINIRGGNGAYVDGEFAGRTGVAWMTGAKTDYTFSFQNSAALSEVVAQINAGGGDYITLWVYVDAEGEFEFVQQGSYFSIANEDGIVYNSNKVPGKTWVKIYIDAATMLGNSAWITGAPGITVADMFSGQMSAGVGLKLFAVSSPDFTAETKVYFDELAVEGASPISIAPEKQSYSVGETLNLIVDNPLGLQYDIMVKTPESDVFTPMTDTSLELTAAGDYLFVLTVPGSVDAYELIVSAVSAVWFKNQ